MLTIAERWAQVRAEIAHAARDAGRSEDDVMLLAVSKRHPAESIREAYDAGARHFGENYLQEALDKQAQLTDLPLHWHFIGPLQSNKTREVAEHFEWVHSVDRFKLARRLSEQRPEHLPPLNICLQVNVSGESSKSGVSPTEVEPLAEAVMELPHIRLRGLMCIPAPETDVERQRRPFDMLAEQLRMLRHQHPQAELDTLSMGMSGDLPAAIAAGSTLVRVGTGIFGPRPA
ncbi:YggS family pyridoxal phosphate enzyme [Terasakiispira papahanaumokuakeensis]|uniref:Pyridoxal phosphate homeostasis protein n=1 Tax=Terasakiispira papahanaumokuakeensis TaxID=197479 RepID=A0A1E2VFT0_9GAMM|nr:YggS family pyridoxal phosphate-dependent enzyme [Terasakiispira papahanaumokuakeensis]ODC05515.1 YggS family pyridoxal phosphate enzyme [Terasakiispira papahanaumokuakeensis]